MIEWRVFLPYDNILFNELAKLLNESPAPINSESRRDAYLYSSANVNIKLRGNDPIKSNKKKNDDPLVELKIEQWLSPSCTDILPGVQRWTKCKMPIKDKGKDKKKKNKMKKEALNSSNFVDILKEVKLRLPTLGLTDEANREIISAIDQGDLYTVAKSRTKFKSNDVQVDFSRLQVNTKIDNIKEQEWISLSIESKNGDIWALRDAIIHLFGNCKYLWNALIKYDHNIKSLNPIIGGFPSLIRAVGGLSTEERIQMHHLCRITSTLPSPVSKLNSMDQPSNGNRSVTPTSNSGEVDETCFTCEIC